METDLRKLSNSALHERHRQVIRLYKAGHKVMKIVELSGFSWPTVRKVIDGYEAYGAASLKPKERGRSQGHGRRLSPAQEAHIRKLICENRPEQIAQLKRKRSLDPVAPLSLTFSDTPMASVHRCGSSGGRWQSL